MHTSDPSSGEAEADPCKCKASLNLHSETLSQKQNKTGLFLLEISDLDKMHIGNLFFFFHCSYLVLYKKLSLPVCWNFPHTWEVFYYDFYKKPFYSHVYCLLITKSSYP